MHRIPCKWRGLTHKILALPVATLCATIKNERGRYTLFAETLSFLANPSMFSSSGRGISNVRFRQRPSSRLQDNLTEVRPAFLHPLRSRSTRYVQCRHLPKIRINKAPHKVANNMVSRLGSKNTSHKFEAIQLFYHHNGKYLSKYKIAFDYPPNS